MIPEIILSGILTIGASDNKAFNDLQVELKRNGYDISHIIEHPEFEIYKFSGRGRYTNYADTTQSWYMKSDSIEKCADFIEEHHKWFEKAENEIGPSKEHLASQLQLETNLGQYTGERPLINSFISVYLARPDRRNEFYRYMTQFLDLFSDTTDNIVFPEDIFDVKGSWAGAYGIAQGMPGVIKKYGEDFDGDGMFDPMNVADAIGFMARYLADHGYSKNSLGATQRYNQGHPFYGSSVGKHTEKLTEVMKRRDFIRRTGPAERIDYKSKVSINDLTSINESRIQRIKMPKREPNSYKPDKRKKIFQFKNRKV